MSNNVATTTSSSKDDTTLLFSTKLTRVPTDHEGVLDALDNDTKTMDTKLQNGEMRAFGRDSDIIFKELDSIRRKQIALARQHVALESGIDDELPRSTTTEQLDQDSAEAFKRNADKFSKKDQELNCLMENLNELMEKLKDLGQLMGHDQKENNEEMYVHR